MVKKNCLEECNKWCSDQPNKDEHLDASWVNSCKIGCSAGACYQEEDYMDEDDDGDHLYSIANRMEFATDSQCPEYLDCL